MTEESRQRRKQLDHERYMRSQKERQEKQRNYYRENRAQILWKKREKAIQRILSK